MILVTGVTGGLGKATIDALLECVPASEISGMVRDMDKATDLLEKGIRVKQGDYLDYNSLVQAFAGVDKLVLISAPAFTDRIMQHSNAIKAARQVGVKHVFFTGIQHRKDSNWILPMVTESDRHTGQLLEESGLIYTIVNNTIYSDALSFFIGNLATMSQVIFPAGAGKIGFVPRRELGEALAKLVTQSGHDNKIYTLTNVESLSFADIITKLVSKPVAFVTVTRQEYVELKVKEGFPRPVAGFAGDWADAIRGGELEEVDLTLARLLGRNPAALKDFLEAVPVAAN